MGKKWNDVDEALDIVEVGDMVEIKYNEDDGNPDTPLGDVKTDRGVVKKAIDAPAGGIYLEMKRDKIGSSQSFKLHNVPGGTITGTLPYGSRSVRIGLKSKIRKL